MKDWSLLGLAGLFVLGLCIGALISALGHNLNNTHTVACTRTVQNGNVYYNDCIKLRK